MEEIGMRIIDMNNIIKNIWVLFVFLLSIGFFIVQSYLFNINWIVLLNFIFLFIIISKNNFLLKNIKKILFLLINIVILFFLLFLVVYSNSCYPDSDYVLRFGNFCLSFIKIIDFSNFISIILTFFILLCFFILSFDFLSKDSKFIVNKYLLFFMLGIFFISTTYLAIDLVNFINLYKYKLNYLDYYSARYNFMKIFIYFSLLFSFLTENRIYCLIISIILFLLLILFQHAKLIYF